MKETQKQLITRLEKELHQAKKELEEYKVLCGNLNSEILEMQQRADKGFLNSSDYIQMNKRIESLEMQNKIHQKTINNNKNVHKLINETIKQDETIKNQRGAGRKSKFTDSEKETIKMYRLQGKTIKEIADMYNCSVGLIHKLINEK